MTNLRTVTWNVQSWTRRNCLLREKVLSNINPHFICLTETHLKTDESIDLHGYTWFSNNRTELHVRAKSGSGGCGIFVKNTIFEVFTVDIVDCSKEGILAIKCTNKFTDFCFVLYCCYLPPENSHRGWDAVDFYAHLLSDLYLHEYCDMVLLCGDFNSRVGNVQDYITDVDEGVYDRQILDTVKNSHGNSLIEFLKDAKCCMLNGRVTPDLNNFTFMSHQGTSVNDYMIVNHEALKYCKKFEVLTRNDYLQNFDLLGLVTESCKPPDHSVLIAEFNTLLCAQQMSGEEVMNNSQYERSTVNESAYDAQEQTTTCKKYRLNTIPSEFMSNDVWNQCLVDLIEMFENSANNQKAVDDCYAALCDCIFKEMDLYLSLTGSSHKVRKKFKYHKPYWDEELTAMWRTMRDKEKIFHMSKKGDRKHIQSLYREFIHCQASFDKLLRKKDRAYMRGFCIKLDELHVNNPAAFWKKLKSLGPKHKKEIPLKVYINGEIITEQEIVLNTWQSEFSQLYNKAEMSESDPRFI